MIALAEEAIAGLPIIAREEVGNAVHHMIALAKVLEVKVNVVPLTIVSAAVESVVPHIIAQDKVPEVMVNVVPLMTVQEEAVSAAHHTIVLAHSLWNILN